MQNVASRERGNQQAAREEKREHPTSNIQDLASNYIMHVEERERMGMRKRRKERVRRERTSSERARVMPLG